MAIKTYSALDFTTLALRKLRVLNPVQSPQAEDGQNGFDALNLWLDDLGTQRQTITNVIRNVFPLANAVSSYTIGDGGTFNVVRPVWIDAVSIRPNRTVTSVLELALPPVLTVDQYQRITLKTQTAPYPTQVFYDHAYTAGLGNVIVWPVPNTSVADLVLYLPTAFTAFADQSTMYGFAPGVARAIVYNLTVELADDYHKTPSDRVERIAVSSLANVKRSNFRPSIAKFDRALVGRRGRFNIYTDE